MLQRESARSIISYNSTSRAVRVAPPDRSRFSVQSQQNQRTHHGHIHVPGIRSVFLKTLANLAAILDKGAAFAAARKIDPSVLLAYRLAPDMLNLTRQVQIAADHAKRAPPGLPESRRRVRGQRNELRRPQGRIDKTIAFVNT